MDIKQANASETNTGFWTTGCGSVCIQSCHQIPNGCISNKLDIPKSMPLPTFCSYRESVSQSNEGQVYIDHNNTSVAFPTMVHPVIENVYTRFNFHFPIPKYFDRPKPKPTPIVSESNISLSSMEGLRQQYSVEGLSDQTVNLLKSSRRLGTLHHYKTG